MADWVPWAMILGFLLAYTAFFVLGGWMARRRNKTTPARTVSPSDREKTS